MKKPEWTFALKLHRCKPDSLPIGRLGEYLTEFAGLLGKDAPVRFAGIVRGSAVLRARVLDDADGEIASRLHLVATGDAPKDATGKAEKLDSMMAQDGLYGEVIAPDGAIIVPFPGVKRTRPAPVESISVSQEGELTGVVTRIGGRDDTVPLLLEDLDGVFYETNVKGRDLAKEIGQHIFGDPIRVYGNGTWNQTSEGRWQLTRFIVHSFEVLDNRPLTDLLTELREIPGNGWADLEDPIEEWRSIRGH